MINNSTIGPFIANRYELRTMRKFLLLFMIGTATSLWAVAQDAQQAVANAFATGNVAAMSEHFDAKVDLTLRGKENSYSKAQAEQMVRDFFARNQAKSYQEVHRGNSKDGALYSIGSLTTAGGTYRTYVLMKNVGGKMRVQQLRIETNE